LLNKEELNNYCKQSWPAKRAKSITRLLVKSALIIEVITKV